MYQKQSRYAMYCRYMQTVYMPCCIHGDELPPHDFSSPYSLDVSACPCPPSPALLEAFRGSPANNSGS